jgi:hypothetical protein
MRVLKYGAVDMQNGEGQCPLWHNEHGNAWDGRMFVCLLPLHYIQGGLLVIVKRTADSSELCRCEGDSHVAGLLD